MDYESGGQKVSTFVIAIIFGTRPYDCTTVCIVPQISKFVWLDPYPLSLLIGITGYDSFTLEVELPLRLNPECRT
ncbi:MAG: hypothetical protein IIB38_09460, partial [Candidatus Hydrogenedentes bacterium]|nr:hypothetical protein [Candidatus Hydrogenedentota bacterium]